MTIEVTSTYTRAAGNGVTTVFNFAFKVFSTSELVVRDILDSTGVPTTKTLGTHYSVTLANGEGGSVTFLTAPANGHTIDIRSLVELTQPEDIRNQGRFLPEIHEQAFDRLDRQNQDTRRLQSLSMQLPDGEIPPDWTTILSLANRKGKYFGFFNASTGAPELYSSIGATTLSKSVINAFIKPQTPAEILAGVVPTSFDYDELDIMRYGADNTGAVSSHAAVTSFNAVLAAKGIGCTAKQTPGTYLFTTQVAWVPLDSSRVRIDAYGCIFKSTGALATFRVSGGTTNGGFSIYGLQIDNHGDANCVAGNDVVGTSRTRFYECHVRPGGNSATYRQWLFRNANPADTLTGSYWPLLSDCSSRRLTGADGAVPNYGVTFRGSANAFQIRGGELGDAVNVIQIEPESGQTPVSNGGLVLGCALEGFSTSGWRLDGAVASEFGGFRFAFNRLEPGVPAVAGLLTGSTTQPATPLVTIGNYMTPDITAALTNANNLRAFLLDSSTNPVTAPNIDVGGTFTGTNRSGSGAALDLTTGAAAQGVNLRRPDRTVVGKWAAESAANTRMQLGSNNASEFDIYGVRSLSQTGTLGSNLSGTGTFAGAALTCVVAFGTAEPDASFRVLITPTSDWGAQTKAPWITAKGTAGFTVNVQATTTNGTFDWFIVRV